MPNMFAVFMREERERAGYGLREFCELIQVDPSNWSKVERGFSAPPTDTATLACCAVALGYTQWQYIELETRAYLGAGRIPPDILSNDAAMNILLRLLYGVRSLEHRFKMKPASA